MFSFGFIIFSIIYVCGQISGKEIDLILALSNIPKRIIQNENKWNEEKPIKILNISDDRTRDLLLSKNQTKEILHLLIKQKNFVICVNLKQNQNKFGTIFSITYKNNVRLLELSVSLSKKAVKLNYSPDWTQQIVSKEKFEFSLSKNQWHSLCFEYYVHNRQFSIRSDCSAYVNKSLRFRLPRLKFLKKNINDFQIWIGQKNSKTGYFKGVVKNIYFSTNSNYSLDFCEKLKQNPIVSPTNSVLELELIVSRLVKLEKEVVDLKLKLIESNNEVENRKKCQCFPLCMTSSGEKKMFTETWQENTCRNCTCTHQGTKCYEEKCPNLSCEHKIVIPGKCCQRCGNNCHYQGKVYSHKTNFTINCKNCHCNDGPVSCRRINPKLECPQLNCNRFSQVKIPGKCCKQCQKINLCDFSNCGTNAFCTSTSNMFKCQCKQGFHGNPYKGCDDINECENPVNCPPSTECVNAEGSFTCICKPGFIRLNPNSLGCSPTCIKNECKNNSTCVAPDQCECTVGYNGPQCDLDIDECKLGLIKCPANSECINIPGSYVCRCVNGYRSSRNGTMSVYYNHHCKDVDECSGIRGIDYFCNIHSTCINIPGGYECFSNNLPDEEKKCRIEDFKNGVEIIDSGKEIINFNTCMKCQCLNGKLTCLGIVCNCTVDAPKLCCKHCYSNECNSAVSLSRQISDFNGFSCMLNNTSCPNKECPKIYCEDSINLPGQCCKFCRSDYITTCMLEYSAKSAELYNDNMNCYYKGSQYKSGEHFTLQLYTDRSCIKCLCWNQYFCCGKSFSCHN